MFDVVSHDQSTLTPLISERASVYQHLCHFRSQVVHGSCGSIPLDGLLTINSTLLGSITLGLENLLVVLGFEVEIVLAIATDEY